MSPSEPPLRGVRVLDLTRLLPGPVCTQHLADLGADVVKVEDTGAGDYAPPALRAIVNRNKRGLQLDLKQPEGAEALLRLARGADSNYLKSSNRAGRRPNEGGVARNQHRRWTTRHATARTAPYGRPPGIPFPVVDEVARHCLQEEEPETVHIEVHLPGRLGPGPAADRVHRGPAPPSRAS